MAAPGTVIFDILAKDRASEVFKHVGVEAKKTGAELESLGKHGGTAMGKLASASKTALLGVAGVAAVTGVVALKMAANFQAQTSVLQTAAGETADGLKIVRKGILDIAMSTGTTWQNLTEGMYQVEKAGYRGAAGLKILTAAAQGAKEENASLEVVTNAMTSVMASYHLGADKSVQVMNALKTAAGGTKDTMQNFAASLSSVLPVAAKAGLSFAQVGGAIAGLTRPGTSAAQATQNLANVITNLQAPGAKAIRQMEQLGISSTSVSQNLGKRGVAGTLQYLVDVISKKMGPSGLVLQDTFKKSQSAGRDMTSMLAQMSPAAHKLADELLSNNINLLEYRKGIKKLPEEQMVMARQFAALAVRSTGFSDALKSGLPQATTMSNLLKTMLGGSTGLNVALALTGQNQAYVNDMTKRTSASMNDHAKSVEGWTQTSKLFNNVWDRIGRTTDTLAISLGNKLMPAAEKVLNKIQAGLQPGSKFRDVLSSLGKTAGEFGHDAKPIFSWIGDHPNLFTQIAKDAVVLVGVLKAKAFLTGLGLLKGASGAGMGGALGGAASMTRPVPVLVTNPGFGGAPLPGPGGEPVPIGGIPTTGPKFNPLTAPGVPAVVVSGIVVSTLEILGIRHRDAQLKSELKATDVGANASTKDVQKALATARAIAARDKVTQIAPGQYVVDPKIPADVRDQGYKALQIVDKLNERLSHTKDEAKNADLLSGGLLSAANNAGKLKHSLDALHDKTIIVSLQMPSALSSSTKSGVHDRMPGDGVVVAGTHITANFHGDIKANNPQDLLLAIMNQSRVGAITGSAGFAARHS